MSIFTVFWLPWLTLGTLQMTSAPRNQLFVPQQPTTPSTNWAKTRRMYENEDNYLQREVGILCLWLTIFD